LLLKINIAVQSEREAIMRLILNGQTEIAQNIVRWDAPKLLERPTLIEITGSTAIDPTIPEGPQKHLTEATLTIRMDAKAAIQLSEQIWDLVRTSGLQ
jgi:type III secretion system FlhB-like substrate exporter